VSTISRQVLEAQLVALNAGRPAEIPVVTDEPLEDLPEEKEQPGDPDLLLTIGEWKQQIDRSSVEAPIVTRRLITAVDIWARGTSSVAAAKLADTGVSWVTQALGGNKLGGLVSHAEELEIQWDRERRLKRMAHVTVFVMAAFITKVNDATAKS